MVGMNQTMITVRSWLRELGITAVLGRILPRAGLLGGANYEEHFSKQMLSELREGDVVWEVGANVGLYTRQFCELVGPQGRVIAFEPTQACFQDLQRNCSAELQENCEVHQLALGRETGTVRMQLADDPLGATHSVLTDERGKSDVRTVAVEMVRGDELARKLPRPRFLKVDVEGSELDVLKGLGEVLANADCRAVFCEVHFGLLAERGQPYASLEIEELLKENGLTDQRWIDASHIRALRPESETP